MRCLPMVTDIAKMLLFRNELELRNRAAREYNKLKRKCRSFAQRKRASTDGSCRKAFPSSHRSVGTQESPEKRSDGTTFMTGLRGDAALERIRSEKLARNIGKIGRIQSRLNGLIDQYGANLLKKVAKEDDDYMLAYSSEMLTVEQKLAGVKASNDSLRSTIQSEGYIVSLEKLLAWFKEEAARLSQNTTGQSTELTALKQRIGKLNKEIGQMEETLRDLGRTVHELEAENIAEDDATVSRPLTRAHDKNKLTVDIPGSKPRTATQLNPRASRSKIGQMVGYMLKNKEERTDIASDVAKCYNEQVQRNDALFHSLEQKIEAETTLQAPIELPKHSWLLELFLSAVDIVRKRIAKRAESSKNAVLKTSPIRQRAHSTAGSGRKVPISAILGEVGLGHFTATDRRAVFSLFMGEAEVYEKVRAVVDRELAREKELADTKAKGSIFGKAENSGLAQMFKTDGTGFRGLKRGEERDLPRGRFQASHLYSASRIPAGFRAQGRRRKMLSESAYGTSKKRPGTGGASQSFITASPPVM